MYKDKNGKYISIHSVVKCNEYHYTVMQMDKSNGREFFIELKNGCVSCWSKPELLEVIN